jgi:hypothetical protein
MRHIMVHKITTEGHELLMGHRPVKQMPYFDRVEKNMRGIGLGTFLGSDPRRLYEILSADQDMVNSLDLTHESIARRLEEIGQPAREAMGDKVVVEDRYEVEATEVRGMIPCPWAHPRGLFKKSHMELKDRKSGETLAWSDLCIHLIREHGFYQGAGSPYRLEPRKLKRVLFD